MLKLWELKFTPPFVFVLKWLRKHKIQTLTTEGSDKLYFKIPKTILKEPKLTSVLAS